MAEQFPNVALRLIDEYFEIDSGFDVPSAYCVRAEAYKALGDVGRALTAYKAALKWESDHPNNISLARIDVAILIVDHRLSDEYEFALDILVDRFQPSEHQMPSYRYYWNGCNALIFKEMGHSVEAQEFAERALRAAAQTQSPFRYHRSVGLVKSTSDEFGTRLKRITRPSKLRALLRVFTRS